MRSFVRHATTLGMIAGALLVALGAVEHWQIGNTAAAIAGAGWTLTLIVLWAMTEMVFSAADRRRQGGGR